MEQKKAVKCLGVYSDRNLNYQDEVMIFSRKISFSNKTIHYGREILPEKSWQFLLNSLVISHLQCQSILLNSISSSKI